MEPKKEDFEVKITSDTKNMLLHIMKRVASVVVFKSPILLSHEKGETSAYFNIEKETQDS